MACRSFVMQSRNSILLIFMGLVINERRYIDKVLLKICHDVPLILARIYSYSVTRFATNGEPDRVTCTLEILFNFLI